MKKQTLAEYLSVKGNTQESLARATNISQTAVSKMLRVGRNILVITNRDGTIELREEKTIAPQKTAS